MRKVNFDYCASSYLTLRTIEKPYKFFKGDKVFKKHIYRWQRKNVHNSFELQTRLRKEVNKALSKGKCALCLSGGIDSAILAKFMPKGSVAYTFKCIVPGVQVTDETIQAAKYAEECGLEHRVIEIYWEDFEKYTPDLMKHKGAPIHSIEVQIYKAALKAKEDGFDTLIFGESADVNFGGQDGLLSKDWTVEEYIKRFSFLDPNLVLKNPINIHEPFYKYSENGKMDMHNFNRHVYFQESVNSYLNACAVANINCCYPFAKTYMAIPMDLERIRSGQNKYLVREVFNKLYPNFEVPKKIPMPRPMNEWLQNYQGPKLDIFKEFDVSKLTGDQKWLVNCLDKFVEMHK